MGAILHVSEGRSVFCVHAWCVQLETYNLCQARKVTNTDCGAEEPPYLPVRFGLGMLMGIQSVLSSLEGGRRYLEQPVVPVWVVFISHWSFFSLSLKFVLGTRAGKHLIPSLAQQIKKFKPYKATSAVGSKSTSSALCHLQSTHLHVL